MLSHDFVSAPYAGVTALNFYAPLQLKAEYAGVENGITDIGEKDYLHEWSLMQIFMHVTVRISFGHRVHGIAI